MSTVQSIARSFAILRVLAEEPCGLSEIGRRARLPKSTVARLVATLEAEGAVERQGQVYWIGPGVTRLADSVGALRRLIGAAMPELRRLVETTHESAGMGVPEGDVIRYVVQLDSDKPVHVRNWTGSMAPLHSAASGLSVLATMAQDAIERYLAGPLERRTANTMVDPAAIRDRLETIRAQGYVWGDEEFVEGINTVASAVCDATGSAIAAIDLFGPSFRFPGRCDRHELGLRVAAAAASVSRALASSP